MKTEIPEMFWRINSLPIPTSEYKFHSIRKWRFDYCFTHAKLAIEIEGGIFMSYRGGKSRHTTGKGYLADMEKYNCASENGYTVLRYTPKNIDFMQIKRVHDNIMSTAMSN